MKAVKIAIAILIVVIVGFAVWNKILLNRCAQSLQSSNAKKNEYQKAGKMVEDAVIKAQSASMMHLGKTIKFDKMELVFPENPPSKINKHPRLLLIFSELACNVCQDEETRFGVGIADQYGKNYVMAVVHATNKRYVRNYIRMNQVNFPVYFSPDESFMEKNLIKNTPMILLIDEENKVIASLFPIPGHFEYSEPFHNFCYHYFNRL